MGYRIFFTSILVLLISGCSSDSDDNDDLESINGTSGEDAALRNLDDVGFEMIFDLAGYKPDQLAGAVPDLATIVIDSAIGSPASIPSGEFLTIDTLEGGVLTETDRTLHQCSGGGTLVHETGVLQLNFTDYAHTREINQYTFDQCLFSATTDRIPKGNYSVNGVLRTDNRSLIQRRSEERVGSNEWTAFDLNGPDALRYEVNGTNAWTLLASPGGATQSRQSEFLYYRKTQGDTIVNQMSDSQFEMNLSLLGGNNENTLNLQFGGSFEDARGGNQVIAINTPTPMTFSTNEDSQLLHTGNFEVQTSDGRFMSGAAMTSGDRSDPSIAPLVDWTSTDADGIVTSDIAAPLGSFSAEFAVCESESTEAPVLCDDGSFRYELP